MEISSGTGLVFCEEYFFFSHPFLPQMPMILAITGQPALEADFGGRFNPNAASQSVGYRPS